jgi:endogenous inhibitor of DNA gyrase (YacG/DUF329 family)
VSAPAEKDWDYAYTCPYCGWEVTWTALRENGMVPYCCRTAEERGRW